MNQFTDEEVSALEALQGSYAMIILKKVLEQYRQGCISQLLVEKDPAKIYETQGRIIGARAIENLPDAIVSQHKKKKASK
jgi:hypothetical protein